MPVVVHVERRQARDIIYAEGYHAFASATRAACGDHTKVVAPPAVELYRRRDEATCMARRGGIGDARLDLERCLGLYPAPTRRGDAPFGPRGQPQASGWAGLWRAGWAVAWAASVGSCFDHVGLLPGLMSTLAPVGLSVAMTRSMSPSLSTSTPAITVTFAPMTAASQYLWPVTLWKSPLPGLKNTCVPVTTSGYPSPLRSAVIARPVGSGSAALPTGMGLSALHPSRQLCVDVKVWSIRM